MTRSGRPVVRVFQISQKSRIPRSQGVDSIGLIVCGGRWVSQILGKGFHKQKD